MSQILLALATFCRFFWPRLRVPLATICRRFLWLLRHRNVPPPILWPLHCEPLAAISCRFVRCAIAHTSFFRHSFGHGACPILRATAIFSISFVLKRAAQACAVQVSFLAPTGGNPHRLAPGHYSIIFAPTGDHRYSSCRRAIIIIDRADGRSSRLIAPTGDHRYSSRRWAIIDCHRADGRPSFIISPTGNQHILSRRRAIIDHRRSSLRRAIIHHHRADGQSAYLIAPTGNHRSPIIIAPTGYHRSSTIFAPTGDLH